MYGRDERRDSRFARATSTRVDARLRAAQLQALGEDEVLGIRPGTHLNRVARARRIYCRLDRRERRGGALNEVIIDLQRGRRRLRSDQRHAKHYYRKNTVAGIASRPDH